MSNDSQGTVTAEAAMMSPSASASASAQGPPLSPSTSSKSQELPGTPVCLCDVCLTCLSVPLTVSLSGTDELVQAGWSKCWSRRENRPYYFNRFTNQSLWEVPVLGQHDVIVSPPPLHLLLLLLVFVTLVQFVCANRSQETQMH